MYIYKNGAKEPVNIGGYQFAAGQELESDIRIRGFDEAVASGILGLRDESGDLSPQPGTSAKKASEPPAKPPSEAVKPAGEGKPPAEEIPADTPPAEKADTPSPRASRRAKDPDEE